MRSKRATTIILISIMALSILSGIEIPEATGKDGSFGGGSGMVDDPYLIEDVYDLQNITQNLSAHYALANDIDASITKSWNNGSGFKTIDGLRGSLDGRGQCIKSLYVNRSDEYFVGLLSNTYGGIEIKNLNLINVTIIGKSFVGGLMGYNNAKISNCSVTGTIKGSDYVGGITGYNHNEIDQCLSNCSVNGNYTGGIVGENRGVISKSCSMGSILGDHILGGLVGVNAYSIRDCYSWAKVEGIGSIGGLVASNSGGVSHSYSSGRVKGSVYVGGLIGSAINTPYASQCYWDINESGQSSSAGGIGLPTNSMMMETSFKSWDFEGIWCIIEGRSYPILRWQDKDPPVAEVGSDKKVEGGSLAFLNGNESTDDIGIANFTWTFNDGEGDIVLYGENVTHVFGTLGRYKVNLNVTDPVGRWDTDDMNLTVMDRTFPVANAGRDRKINEDQILTFDGLKSSDNVGIANWTWSFKDWKGDVTLFGGSPTHLFSVPGSFVVTLKVTDQVGLTDKDTIGVTVKDVCDPIADAGPDMMVDEDTTITFDGGRSSDDGGITKYTWTVFDRNGIATLYGEYASFMFTTPGSYDVNLKVMDGGYHTDVDTLKVTVKDITPPVAVAGPDILTNETEINFFDAGDSHDNVGIVNYTWKFATVTIYDVIWSYTFDRPQMLSVNLTVRDAAGNIGSDVLVVTVKDDTRPVSDAGRDQIVNEDTTIIFDGSGSEDNIGIVEMVWSFRDVSGDKVLIGERPTYVFSQPGTYRVNLRVADASGLWSSDTCDVSVLDITPPQAYAGSDAVIDEGSTFLFDGGHSGDNVGIRKYIWSFNDGTDDLTLQEKAPSYTFTVPGVLEVTLIVIDGANNADSDSMTLTVTDTTPPVAAAGPDMNVRRGGIVSFNGNASTDNVGVMNYTWTFNDGSDDIILYGVDPSYTFENPGEYIITLTVIDAAGISDVDTMTVTVTGERSDILLYMLVALILLGGALTVFLVVRSRNMQSRKR